MIFRFYRHVSLLPGAGPLEDALRLEDALEAGPELRRRARASREPNHELTFAPDQSLGLITAVRALVAKPLPRVVKAVVVVKALATEVFVAELDHSHICKKSRF